MNSRSDELRELFIALKKLEADAVRLGLAAPIHLIGVAALAVKEQLDADEDFAPIDLAARKTSSTH